MPTNNENREPRTCHPECSLGEPCVVEPLSDELVAHLGDARTPIELRRLLGLEPNRPKK